MAIKITPSQRSVIVQILSLILSFIGGSAVSPLLSSDPVCPPETAVMATPMRAAAAPKLPRLPSLQLDAVNTDDAGIGGNSSVEPAGGAPRAH